MTSKGQVTVPQAIREALGLEAGSKLVFELDEEGQVLVQPLRHRLEDLWELGEARRSPGAVMNFEAMNEAKLRGASGAYKPGPKAGRKPAR
jgi:AbrB family looped-hinge helix DNA binding protein